MDYRHTEEFARQIETAALRAPALRAEAIAVFWGAIFTGVASLFRALGHRLAEGGRADKMQPGA